MSSSRLVNRNVISGTGRTSMRLEPELWEALRDIALRENSDVGSLIRRIEAQSTVGGRTSAVRVFIVQYFRAALDETVATKTNIVAGLNHRQPGAAGAPFLKKPTWETIPHPST
jgi:predicted DNA-binding ribbon-helix-helix protein